MTEAWIVQEKSYDLSTGTRLQESDPRRGSFERETARGMESFWSLFDQRVIDNAVKQWRERLRACVRADGGQFEHQLQ